MLKRLFLKALSRTGGNPCPVSTLQQNHSSGTEGRAGAHAGQNRSSSLLSACAAMKAAQQAEAFQLLYKSTSSPKPSSPAHPTNQRPNIEHDFSSPYFFITILQCLKQNCLLCLSFGFASLKLSWFQVHPKR